MFNLMENSVVTALSGAFLISVSIFVASSPLGFVAFVKATLLCGLMLLFPKKSSIFREPWKKANCPVSNITAVIRLGLKSPAVASTC
ncbi:MAG: hypothetical protein IJE62_03830 [Clostridia bacterium]|nr:hypothetical protein [Clostridia bacterium]